MYVGKGYAMAKPNEKFGNPVEILNQVNQHL